MQEQSPATVQRPATDGGPGARVQLARSRAFEQWLATELASRGVPTDGAIVLVRAEAESLDRFHGNLTFVQGHVAFHPDTSAPSQFGVLDGALGTLASDAPVLAYTVLPAHIDVTKPVDIYWNDRRITATLSR